MIQFFNGGRWLYVAISDFYCLFCYRMVNNMVMNIWQSWTTLKWWNESKKAMRVTSIWMRVSRRTPTGMTTKALTLTGTASLRWSLAVKEKYFLSLTCVFWTSQSTEHLMRIVLRHLEMPEQNGQWFTTNQFFSIPFSTYSGGDKYLKRKAAANK